jgi:hypothetical protein
MFVPRPQTTHVPRHYTARKTGNKDKENAGALPTKTPSRGVGGAGKMLVPNTTRIGLGAKAGDGKGKGKEVDDIGEVTKSAEMKYANTLRTQATIHEHIQSCIVKIIRELATYQTGFE